MVSSVPLFEHGFAEAAGVLIVLVVALVPWAIAGAVTALVTVLYHVRRSRRATLVGVGCAGVAAAATSGYLLFEPGLFEWRALRQAGAATGGIYAFLATFAVSAPIARRVLDVEHEPMFDGRRAAIFLFGAAAGSAALAGLVTVGLLYYDALLVLFLGSPYVVLLGVNGFVAFRTLSELREDGESVAAEVPR